MNCYLQVENISAFTCDEGLKTFVEEEDKKDYIENLISRAEDFLHQFIGASCFNSNNCVFSPVPKDIERATFEIFYEIYRKDPCSNVSSSTATSSGCGVDDRRVKKRTISDSSISVEYADDNNFVGVGIEAFIPLITRITLNKYKNSNPPTSIGIY